MSIEGKYFKLSFDNYPTAAYIYVIEASVHNDNVLLEQVLEAHEDRVGWSSYPDWRPLSWLQEISKEEFIEGFDKTVIQIKEKYDLL